MIRAWHFVADTLRDGRPVPPDGEWLKHSGPLQMCVFGLHASREPFDALKYAPGPVLCLVECDGEVIEQDDKLVCSRRRIVARMDATEMLQYYARMQALSVIHLWDAPDVVLDYLMTGDQAARAARAAAAWAAAARAAAAGAAGAAWAAAREATREAAARAAWAAARDAAREAAAGAAWAAARDAAREAAAWAAAARAVWAAARDAAWAAARADFNALAYECFESVLEAA